MSTYRKSIAGAGAGADAALSSSENRPIILTNSEDDMEIDTSEVEIDKIATKYMKRRSTERTKRMIVFISTLIMIFSLTTFVFIRSMKSRSVARGSKGRSKHGHNDYINDPNHPNRKIQVPKHNAFTLVKSKFLPGYQASIHLYQHTKTQAEFIAYRPMDTMQDKAFGISFRTKPTSNNGVAHILEHSVLSGSKNYPAKDPFLHLLKGSLHTFLNAMTYNDRTVYPVASRNSKDFKNLMSVYLDAVFYPNCVQEDGEWILKQEGWRYEPIEDGDDDDKKENVVVHLNSDGTTETRKRLEVKGVVYSEMKGVFSNPESIIYRHSDKLLFPDNTYFHDSGGEPKEIPTLTHTEFVDFYNRHYHPTNSKIFVSGTLDDIESAMEIIDSGYLSKYDLNVKIKNESQIQFQKKNFGHHLYQSIPYAVAEETPDEGQHLLLITWLLNDDFFKTQMLELAFYVLDYLLIGTMSSPLNKVLMESDLGSNVIGGGLSPGLLQTTFAVGMKGVKNGDIAELEGTILNVFHDVVKTGFSDGDIEAAMNSIEFQLREVHAGSDPMGISIFLQLLEKWNYDADPFSALEFETALVNLKKAIKTNGSSFFVNLIDKYFLRNNHRVHMELRPSENLEEDNQKLEMNKMRVFENSLSSAAYEAIKTQADLLKKIQNTDDTQDVVDTIPSLSIQDIDKSGDEFPIEVTGGAHGTSATLVTHPIDGSPGIVYIDVGVDIASVPFEEIGLLPLITTMLSECNTTSYSRTELDRLIGTYTGGINAELVLLPVYDADEEETVVTRSEKMRTYLFLRGKCTVENAATMLGLFKEIFENSIIVSQEKAIQLIERQISSYKSSIASRGHSYAVMRMHGRYDAQSSIDERLHGYNQLHTLQSLLGKAKDNWDKFEARLSKILKMNSKIPATGTVINLTGDSTALYNVQVYVQDFIKSLHDSDKTTAVDYSIVNHPWIERAQEKMSKSSPLHNEGIVVSSQVSYVGKGGLLYDLGEKVSGSSCVPLQYLKKGYLWDEVRAKNGAYGVMAQLDKLDGTLFMVSYRDPNLVNTLKIYDGAADFLTKELEEKVITQKEITRAIIGCIGALDGSALPPRNAGWISFNRYLSNSSAARRQIWRDGILNTKEEGFVDFAKRLKQWKNVSVAVVGSEHAIQDANENSNLELKLIEAY